ncbi:Fe-S-containing protein [Thiovibrio sp. JS02]
MKRFALTVLLALAAMSLHAGAGFAFWGDRATSLAPVNGKLFIPLASISDGRAHYFKVEAGDGLKVTFFTLMSNDGVLRAAIDACDVCFRSGKGYLQDGDFMVCQNCGMRFASARINDVKGGCNPAPLTRVVEGDKLVISMADINRNSWYCRFKR